jgi:hypothetical protein
LHQDGPIAAPRLVNGHYFTVDPDELYGLPLDRFTAERTALARGLRSEGRRDEAAEVAALRKPSVAAWAVNQLVRTQPTALARLFDAGDELRIAQSAVLAGRQDGHALREAAERERNAVQALTDAARGLLSSAGDELSPAVLEKVWETLHAAALDEDARAAVRDGRLERELRHVGLGARAPTAPATRRKAAAEPRATGARQRAASAQPRADAKAAERRRADAHRAARIAEAEARREAERAGRALKIARERRDHAAEALSDAEQALANAASEVRVAADAHRRAREELDRAQ